MTVFDPDAPTGSGFWHWVLVDIPGDVTELPAGAGRRRGPARRGVPRANDAGMNQYVGPFPPPGHGPHRYAFAVHAVDTDTLGVDDSVSPAVVGFNVWQHTLGPGGHRADLRLRGVTAGPGAGPAAVFLHTLCE